MNCSREPIINFCEDTPNVGFSRVSAHFGRSADERMLSEEINELLVVVNQMVNLGYEVVTDRVTEQIKMLRRRLEDELLEGPL